MTAQIGIRDATFEDMAAVTAIYNDAVATTTAIWNDAMVDEANRQAWLADRTEKGYPVLVAVGGDGLVCGYAALGPFRAFDGFRFTAELSLYVKSGQRGRGIGKQLLSSLIDRGRTGGFHVLIAAIEAGNAPSLRLHQAVGFQQVGFLPQVGTKFGQWLDLVFMQLSY